MAIKSFLSEGGFSVGSVGSAPIEVIDPSGNVTAVGLTVSGNLIVNGSTTTINSTTTTLDDPIFTLGGDTAPTSDDNKDRGIEFRWHTGSLAKVGFFGYDDSTGKFTFIPDATNTSEVFAGTKGTLDANIEWADVLNKPDPVVTVTLTGDVTGTANATLTDLGNGTITVATTIAADSIALGTDTTGNYVASITNGSYITGGNGGSEGAALTLAVDATSANTASKVVARDASGNFSAGVITGTRLEARNSGTTQIHLDSTTSGSKEIVFQNNGATAGYVWASGSYVGLGGGGTATSLFVTAASGNTGIGTTSPGGRLEVNFTAATGATALILRTSDGGANGTIRWQNSTAVNGAAIGSNYNVSDVGALEFLNGNTTNVIFRSSGNVGIGTTAPGQKLEVNGNILAGNSVANNSISVTRTGANSSSLSLQAFTDSPAITWDGAGGYLRFIYSSTEQMRITSGGNVGIGVTSPGAKLDVNGNTIITGSLTVSGSDATIHDVSIGRGAGSISTNTRVGNSALSSNTVGNNNTAVGFQALNSNTTGLYNIAVGASALASNSGGRSNVAIGFQALNANTGDSVYGSNNIAVGGNALLSNSTGYRNIAVGVQALPSVTTGGFNTAIGFSTGGGITTGFSNTIIGSNVIGLPANLSGNIIIADGDGNRRINVDNSGNVGIGRTSPQQKLHIAGTNARIAISNDADNNWAEIGNDGASGQNTLEFFTGSSTSSAVSITNANNVGIGTSTPSDKLHVVGNVVTTGGVYNIEGTTIRVLNPGGAVLNDTTGPATGAIKIKLPTAAYNSNTMMTLVVDIYNYDTGKSLRFRIGGYNYQDGNWYSIFAEQTSDLGVAAYNVRFGSDGTSNCIWIGETNSTWQYPKVFVSQFLGAHSATTSVWASGWAISKVTAFDTVNTTRAASVLLSNNNIANFGVSSITGTANQVTASASTGAVTLSLPQSIHTGATPTFSSLALSGDVITLSGSGVSAYANSTARIYNQTGVGPTINGNSLEVRTGSSGTLALTLSSTQAATFAGAVTSNGSVLVTGASKNMRIRDTAIMDANYDTLSFQAYDQNVFSIGVGAVAGTPNQIRINGATNGVAFTGAVTGITALGWTGGTTATSTGNHVFGTTNTVIMSAGTLTTTGAATFAGAVTAPSLTGPATTNLTLTGGSTGASLVLGATTSGVATVNTQLGSVKFNTEATTTLQLYGTSTGNTLLSGNTALSGGKLLTVQGSAVTFAVSGLGEAGRFASTTGNLLIGNTTDIPGSGGLKVFGTTAASSTTSGALQVGSNVGLSGNAGGPSYFGGNVILPAGYELRFGAGGNDRIYQSATSGGSLILDAGGVTRLTLNSTAATFAGAVSFGGNVGVGTAAIAAVGVYVPASINSSSGYGISSVATFGSATNVIAGALYGKVTTAAASFTVPNGYGLQIDAPTIGAASAVTSLTGISIANQGATGITNAYGIDIAAQSGAATTNVGLRNAGLTLLTNATAGSAGAGALVVQGGGYFAQSTVIGSGGATGLTINAGSGQNALVFQQSGTSKWVQYLSSGSLAWFNSNLAANAFILDTATSAATFAGAVTVSGGSALIQSGTANPFLHIKATADTYNPYIRFEGWNRNYYMGARDTGADAIFSISASSALTSPIFSLDLATSAATFAGAVTVSSKLEVSGQISVSVGSEATPAYAFASDLDTGFFSPTANQLGIVTGGVSRARFTSTEIRVGNNLSTADLGVESKFIIVGSENTPTLGTLIASLGFSNESNQAGQTSAEIAKILVTSQDATANQGRLEFQTKNGTTLATRMMIDKSGNVSIASTTAGSAGAGALVVTGGLATGAASYFGGNVSVAGTAQATLLINSIDAASNGSALALASGGSYKWIVKAASFTDGSLFTIGTATGVFTSTPVLSLNHATAAATFAGAVSITGNLTVNGTTTTVNSTVSTIKDPIVTLGGGDAGTAAASDDNKDRGIEFKWHNGTAAKTGFFGFDDSTGYFTFIPDATNTSEVFSGTQGDIQASNFRGNLIGNVTGNVSGSAGSVATLTAGSYLTGTSFNGSTAVTFAVDATSANTVSKVVARDASGNFSAGTITASSFSGNLANTLTLNTSGTGLSGSTTFNNSGAATFTVTSNATNANTASTIVARDASGNFTAGTITAALSGNASTAATWQTARTLTIGSTGKSVNGSADVAWTLSEIGAWPTGGSWAGDFTSNSYTRSIGYAAGGGEFALLLNNSQISTLIDGSYNAYEAGGFYSSNSSTFATRLGFNADSATSLNFNTTTVKLSGNQILHAGNYTAYVGNGTLTLAVSGTGLSGSSSFTANQSGNTTFTVTSNATSANTASTIVARDASGNFSAGTINAIAATGYLPVQLALVNNGSATVGSTRFSAQPDGAGGYISFNGAVTANSSGTIVSGSSTVTGDHASRKVGLFQYTGGTTGTAGFQFFTADAGTNAILTERLRIQHDGNVGIGTMTPGSKLDITGNQVLNGLNSTLALNRSGAGDTSLQFAGSAGKSAIQSVNGAFSFWTSATTSGTNFTVSEEKVRINTSGNVGIGITSPATLLHTRTLANTDNELRVDVLSGANKSILGLANNGTDYGQLYFDNATNAVILNQRYSSGYLGLGANSRTTDLVILASTGNVGIGTTSPGGKLVVNGDVGIGGDPYYSAKLTVDGNSITAGSVGIAATRGGPVTTLVNDGATSATSKALKIINSSGSALATFEYGGNVGIGTASPSYKLEVNGSFAATTKSFVIKHPTKEGKKLRYGSLEGPENGVYVRGKLKGSNVIELPDYWTKLVDPESITVQLTPIGSHQKLYVEKIEDNKVYIANENLLAKAINCFFYVLAERIDVEKLQVEIDA